MARKMVTQKWGPIPARRGQMGKGADATFPDDDQFQDITYEEVDTDGPNEQKLGTPGPDASFVSRPAYCSTVGKVSKRSSGGGL
jgi:hypothetical protein